eukprot:gb/GFBE01051469.1/.p1 GENE.gb/GFBE01051469.1/~~gb/GFBE01051469.1/.p1  ORF type:complete len:444 (+),score=120.37 gb/GFBE01051469.1/:1-1332(+)
MKYSRPLAFLLLAGTAWAHKQGQHLRRKQQVSTCSCDCCSVASRRPDERKPGVSVKCAPNDGHSRQMCSDQCSPAVGDGILGLMATEGVLDYTNFCFHECKPAEGPMSLLATQCLSLEEKEANRVLDQDGNAMDPAFLYSERPGAAEQKLAEEEAQASLLLKETQEPEEVDPAAAKETALQGRADVKEALNITGDAVARLRASEEANMIPDLEAAGDPLLVASKTRDLAEKAEDLAATAAADAEKSIEALKSGRNETWKSAMWQANKALNFMKRTDYRLATAPTKPWRVQATQAARAAAAPYMQTAAVYGQHAVQLNRQGAYDAASQAKNLRSQADDLETQAGILKRRGDTREAELTEEHAAFKEQQAQQLDAAAKAMVDAARQGVEQTLANGYMKDANLAANQAVQNLKLPVRYQWALQPDPLRNWVPSAPDPWVPPAQAEK